MWTNMNLFAGCHEVRPNGWYQPMVINHAALEKMKVAHLHYGLMDTCNTFGVTHDVGMGKIHLLFYFSFLHVVCVFRSVRMAFWIISCANSSRHSYIPRRET